MVSGFVFRVSDFGFRVSGLGFRTHDAVVHAGPRARAPVKLPDLQRTVGVRVWEEEREGEREGKRDRERRGYECFTLHAPIHQAILEVCDQGVGEIDSRWCERRASIEPPT